MSLAEESRGGVAKAGDRMYLDWDVAADDGWDASWEIVPVNGFDTAPLASASTLFDKDDQLVFPRGGTYELIVLLGNPEMVRR